MALANSSKVGEEVSNWALVRRLLAIEGCVRVLFLQIVLLTIGLGGLSLTGLGIDVIQFFFLANLFFSPVQSLGIQFNQAMTAMAGAERVFRLLDCQPAWGDDPNVEGVSNIQ